MLFGSQNIKVKGSKAAILMWGDIGDGWWSPVSASEIAGYLSQLDNVEEIEVRINSRGGSVFAGVALYSYLKAHKAKIKVHIDGLCASIATVIAMAGDEIHMSNSAQFMIHNPWTVATGDSKNLVAGANVLDGLKVSIINSYLTKTNLTKEELANAMDKTTYYTAEEALNAGFITNIENNFDPKNLISGEQSDLTYASFQNTEKEGKKEMTKEELKNQHLEIYNSILNEGKEQERARFKALESLPTNEATKVIINSAKFETYKNANEIAMEILNTMNSASTPPSNDPFAKRFEDAKNLGELGKDSGNGGESADEKRNREIAEYLNLAEEL